MPLPNSIPPTYRPKCSPKADAVAPTPPKWERYSPEQDVLAVGIGAPVDHIAQYVFTVGSAKHTVAIAYLLEDRDRKWTLIWTCEDHEVETTNLLGNTQTRYETYDAMITALTDYMAGIENHVPAPQTAVGTIVPDDRDSIDA